MEKEPNELMATLQVLRVRAWVVLDYLEGLYYLSSADVIVTANGSEYYSTTHAAVRETTCVCIVTVENDSAIPCRIPRDVE